MPHSRLPVASLALLLFCAAVRAEEKPAPKEPSSARTVPELAKSLRPSVVVITFAGRDGKQQGLGTGFIVAADGLIATNLHVVGEARPVTVHTSDGKTYPVKTVHASDRSLDLALLRIDAKGLPPLELGDSDGLQNGQAVVVLGHPRGLEHSVVSGVVSGRPKIEDRHMIQLAIPIEPGNSGGPVLDMQGRVQGVVTLKSQLTPNLGFAMPVNALKTLLRKPNPIPMARWVTIGTLNPNEWTTLFEGRWRQRHGVITADGQGVGFGGRSLCLAKDPPPELPYEVAVTVRLDTEAGAGGLAFHADGGDRHYGFYPSGGKLRLSRFEGPDVFTWKVLHNEASPHYRPGEWNTLKVRVEKDRLLCYVNDQLAIESNDSGLTAGKIGLVKFRDTRVEYKNFQVGRNLASVAPSADLVTRVGKLVKELSAEGPPQANVVDSLTPNAASVMVLRQQAKDLEEKAGRLRRLAQVVHEKRVFEELGRIVQEKEIDLIYAALVIARLDNEELDVDAYRRQVERLAKDVAAALPKDADEKAKLTALNKELFEVRGFHGSRADYYNKSNSYLNEVLEDREGLPITLSMLYADVARRLGLKVVGIGLPGHFVVQHQPAAGKPYLIDVYEGGKVLARAEAEKKVKGITGERLRAEHLKPLDSKAILVRLLHNLASIAQRAEDIPALVRYQSAILTIAPELVDDRLMRAAARYRGGDRLGALEDLDWLLEHAPEGVDRNRVLELRGLISRQK